MGKHHPVAGEEGELVYTPYFRHHKTGQVVRRAGGRVFVFRSKRRKDDRQMSFAFAETVHSQER